MADIAKNVLSDGTTLWYKDKYARDTLPLKAPLESPHLTGVPTAPTAEPGTSNTQIATTAFVQEAFVSNDAMVYKGTIGGASATVQSLPSNHKQGWTYRVAEPGTYAGVSCETGDMIICNTDGTSADNSHWNVIQTNIDGAVVGPVSVAADGNVALFNGQSGKVIKDGGTIKSLLIDDNLVVSPDKVWSITKVKDYVIRCMDYELISITSFDVTPAAVVEDGTSVESRVLEFTLGGNPNTPKTIKLNNNTITPTTITRSGKTVYQYTVTPSTPYTTKQTWTLKVTNTRPDDSTSEEVSKSATLNFYPYVFYGSAGANSNPDTAFIRGLDKVLDADGKYSFTITTTGSNYIWYASTVECAFNVGGFDGGFNFIGNIDVECGSKLVQYKVYRSTNPGLGKKTVTVK